MTTFTTQSKSTAAVFADATKSSTTFTTIIKGGLGWLYDQASITYDALTDSANGNQVFYDSDGSAPVWTNQNKS